MEEENSLKCAVCEMVNGEKREDESIVVITLVEAIVEAISKAADATKLSFGEIPLCDICERAAKKLLLYKCLRCRNALAQNISRNEEIIGKDKHENIIRYTLNDTIARLLKRPVEEIAKKPVVIFTLRCPLCSGDCSGKCDGGCDGKCHEKCSHEKDKS